MPSMSITVIEKISTNQFILKCACCNGTGRMARDHDDRSPYVPCTVCNGRGVVLVEIEGSLPFVKCQLCNGSGEQSRDCDNRSPYIICTRCKGVGAQPIAGIMKIIK